MLGIVLLIESDVLDVRVEDRAGVGRSREGQVGFELIAG